MTQDRVREAWCEVCGARLPSESTTCPACGNSNELSSLLPGGTGNTPARVAVAPRRRRRTVLYFGLVAVCAVVIVGIALAAGIYSGLQEVKQRDLSSAQQHYERGLELLQSGDYALAVAEFEYVERIRPGFRDAGTMLESARQAMLAKPTPTSEARQDIAANLLARAQDEMEQEAWSKAIRTLQELRRLSPEYKPEQVTPLLFQSMYSAGLQAAEAADLEVALEWFKQARELNPDDADVRRQIALADSYLQATAEWGRDWPAVIDELDKLYQLSPEYADVQERLATAYTRYGDELSSDNDWCAAAGEYARALSIKESQATATKGTLASQYCSEPPATGTETPEVLGTVTAEPEATAPLLPGGTTLYFALADANGNIGVYAFTPGSKPLLLIANADQPAPRTDGSLAFRNLASDRLGISQAGSDGSFAARISVHAEDSWPTWESGDGRLAFASTRESDRKWRIYVADNWVSGADAAMIAYGKSPAWGPTGMIAYRGCDQSGNNCGIYLMRPDGTPVGQVTDNANDDMPAWSADGTRLAFASPRSGSWSIWLKDMETGRLTRLTDGTAHDASPVWSRDGKWIAFISNRGDTWGLWVVSTEGGEAQLLFDMGSLPRNWDETLLAWR